MKRSVAVLAGGLGTRVAHLTPTDVPKAMLPVGGRPFVDLKLAELVAAGADEIVMLTGFGAQAVRAHVCDETAGGVPVRFVDDGPDLLGTGGAIRRALDLLPDPFWVTYGDTLLSVELSQAEDRISRAPAIDGVMTVLRNEDRWQRSNVSIDPEMIVTKYDKSAPPGSHAYIDYGMLLLTHDLFAARGSGAALDLTDILRDAAAARRLAASVVDERFHDIGTEDAWRDTDRWARESFLWDRLQEQIGTRAAHRHLS
jgi:N-acetyl-alpha-D-muramate 1-phosphate uridylyltransferase